MNLRHIVIIILISLTFGFTTVQGAKQINEALKAHPSLANNIADTIYKTKNLIIVRISPHVYQHISFLETASFGRVPSNGAVMVNSKQAIIFDTAADKESSAELIKFVTKSLKAKILAVIPTHFHEDCVAGIEVFNKYSIPVYASNRTIQILKDNGNAYASQFKGINEQLVLKVGSDKVMIDYIGEGHTKDNITGYFPSEGVMFGGCLIKELGASKGNLEDANVQEWPLTVRKLKQKYPNTVSVIPGHGSSGGAELLDYTVKLFQ